MIDTDKYEGHTPAPWMMGEYKGRPSIHAGNETFVRSIARGLNPSQTADHALLLDAPLLLERVIQLEHILKCAKDVLTNIYTYDKDLEDAEWIAWFCDMEDEEE